MERYRQMHRQHRHMRSFKGQQNIASVWSFLWLNLENHWYSQNAIIASEYKIVICFIFVPFSKILNKQEIIKKKKVKFSTEILQCACWLSGQFDINFNPITWIASVYRIFRYLPVWSLYRYHRYMILSKTDIPEPCFIPVLCSVNRIYALASTKLGYRFTPKIAFFYSLATKSYCSRYVCCAFIEIHSENGDPHQQKYWCTHRKSTQTSVFCMLCSQTCLPCDSVSTTLVCFFIC